MVAYSTPGGVTAFARTAAMVTRLGDDSFAPRTSRHDQHVCVPFFSQTVSLSLRFFSLFSFFAVSSDPASLAAPGGLSNSSGLPEEDERSR